MSHWAKDTVLRLLESAGVAVGGASPWDIQVHDEALYPRVLAQGSLGLGEAYMDGWWDCARLDEFFYRVLHAGLDARVISWKRIFPYLGAWLVNLQTPSRAFHIGRHHYDLGNDLFRLMLGERMIYSGAFWKDAETLDQAQESKLDLVCRKLGVSPGMRVLDIGCGWGGTAQLLAQCCQVEVVGITVSAEQVKQARELCRGLPVDVRLEDYRSLHGTYDRIVSIGMFEHVGSKNYGTFMQTARRVLKEDGLMLLQTIGVQQASSGTDPWIARYIFPNSELPSARRICAAIEGRFVMEHWENLGVHYDKTLLEWHRNFRDNWDAIRAAYDDRFYRMWEYYLLSCAGAFRARTIQLWQLVLSPRGVPGGYRIAGRQAATSS